MMSDILNAAVLIMFVGIVLVVDYRRQPRCSWCRLRHYGRCIYNPRAGRFWANVNDGHFDYHDPNK